MSYCLPLYVGDFLYLDLCWCLSLMQFQIQTLTVFLLLQPPSNDCRCSQVRVQIN
jgi:hypothetical protein